MADYFDNWQKITKFYKAVILQLKNRKYQKISNKVPFSKKKKKKERWIQYVRRLRLKPVFYKIFLN